MEKNFLEDKFLEDFNNGFSHMQRKKIVLYGIGKKTALLVDKLTQYNFIGLMDKDPGNIGKVMPFGKGITIFDQSDIVQQKDIIIIIIASEVYWEIIFKRIKNLQLQHNIPIYYQNGQLASDVVSQRSDLAENAYWDNTKAGLCNAIDKHEVISFDLFDTLVMRKIMIPSDVFELIQIKLQGMYKKLEFAEIRKRAYEKAYTKYGDRVTLDLIYEQFCEMTNLSNGDIARIKQIEIETEVELVTPRGEMIEILAYCLEKHKKVYILTDMYLSRDSINLILEKCLISNGYELWISTELNIYKHNGSMWQRFVRKNYQKKCLHIGDDLKADIIQAGAEGITTWRIYSGYQLFENSSVQEVVPEIRTLGESLTFGSVISRLFNGPFCLAKSKGQVQISSLSMLGFVVFGPLIWNFLIWLLKENIKHGQDKILFFARDGYVIEKAYKIIIERLNIAEAPEGEYFKISRRMAMVAAINDRETYEDVVRYEYQGTFGQYLEKRFGIEPDANDENAKRIIDTGTDFEKILYYLEQYKERIFRNAFDEGKAYLEYIRDRGIFANERTSIVDLFYTGTGQYYLSKLTSKSFVGFYFCALMSQYNIYGMGKNMKALYQNVDDPMAMKSNVKRYSQLIESVLTAPEGMYIRCLGENQFLNAEKCFNQIIFAEKEKIHEGIFEYIKEMVDLYVGVNVGDIPHCSMCVDRFIGVVFSNSCTISEEIKQTFSHDDELFGFRERKIWD